ncbi:MAG: trehalose 6-phosphate phosphatase [Solirubrobacterales bacterium]|jgi:trehalose-phosphatase|nr:trehalose 6-phosphate phosphatase [Solirubrobacterales bacterium]
MPAADVAPEPVALLAPLRDEPAATAILTDVDGTIAPIAVRPEDARVLPEAARLLDELAGRYALVACISGRRVLDARALVGLAGIAYIGNHGLERLLPGEDTPGVDPVLDGHQDDAAAFVSGLGSEELDELGLRLEDKGPIQALHWRGAENESAAESRIHEIAADAEWRGLIAAWGRKVLEIRPPISVGKGQAIKHLLAERKIKHALYAGDDRTDLDAFAALRELRDAGALETAACIGIRSSEGPPQIATDADIAVDGPEGFVELLRQLAD